MCVLAMGPAACCVCGIVALLRAPSTELLPFLALYSARRAAAMRASALVPSLRCAGAAFCALRILTICHTHAQTSYLSVRGHVVLSPRLVNENVGYNINIPICLYSVTRLL